MLRAASAWFIEQNHFTLPAGASAARTRRHLLHDSHASHVGALSAASCAARASPRFASRAASTDALSARARAPSSDAICRPSGEM